MKPGTPGSKTRFSLLSFAAYRASPCRPAVNPAPGATRLAPAKAGRAAADGVSPPVPKVVLPENLFSSSVRHVEAPPIPSAVIRRSRLFTGSQ
jgi:hypothetical protein